MKRRRNALLRKIINRKLAREKINKRRAFNALKKNIRPKRIRLPIGGFQDAMLARLRYVQTVSLDPVAGAIATHIFRATSCFDPDQTGAGHQPSNFDRLAAIYDKYTVYSSKIWVYPVWTDSTNKTPGVLAVKLSENGTDLSTAHASGGVANVLEQPKLARSIRHIAAVNNPATDIPLTVIYSGKKFFGGNFPQDEHSADVTANPTENANFEVAYMSADDANNPDAMNFRVEIEYIVRFTEPLIADAS